MNERICDLPKEIADPFIDLAIFLRNELLESKLEVILKESEETGHYNKKRSVVNTNPQWYRDLYSLKVESWKPKDKKNDVKFRQGKGSGQIRKRTVKALNRIIENRDFKTSYDTQKHIKYEYHLRDIIKDMLVKGYNYMGQEIPSNIDAKAYFEGNYEEVPF